MSIKTQANNQEDIAMFTTIKEYFKFNSNERLARNLVRSYFPSSSVDFKKESKGTVRFIVDGIKDQGFYRVRSSKDRGLGSDHINSFDQVHVGKITIAVERQQGRDLWNFALTAEQE